MNSTAKPSKSRTAGFFALAAVAAALWTPISVVAHLPLTVAAGAASLALSALAGMGERAHPLAPAAFLISVALLGTAVVLHLAVS